MSGGALVDRAHHLPRVYRWLKSQNRVKKAGTRPFSHTVLDGPLIRFGPIIVDDDEHDHDHLLLRRFYQVYVESYANGEALYFAEWPIPDVPMRLYFDLDILLSETTPQLACWLYKPMFACIQRVLRTVVFADLDDAAFDLIIGSGGYSKTSKRIAQKEQVCVKLGLHLTWPHIFVQKHNLPAIRTAVLRDLAKSFPRNKLPLPPDYDFKQDNDSLGEGCIHILNPWSSVIDENIAKAPSSRMFFSRKIQPCKCKKERVECVHVKDSRGKGYEDIGRVYKLATVMNVHCQLADSTMTNEFPNTIEGCVRLLMSVSLRISGAESPINIAATVSESIANHLNDRNMETLTTDDPRDIALRTFLYLVFPNCADVVAIRYRERPPLYVCSSNNKSCFNNYNCDHSAATTFIMVSPIGIMRKCFHTGDDERLMGRCKEVHETIRVPHRLASILFGKINIAKMRQIHETKNKPKNANAPNILIGAIPTPQHINVLRIQEALVLLYNRFTDQAGRQTDDDQTQNQTHTRKRTRDDDHGENDT